MNITTPGCYPNIPNETYHADPCATPSLSRSMIHGLVMTTPAHVFARAKRLNPLALSSEKKAVFDVGTAAHELFLQGIDNVYVVEADDFRTKAAQQQRDEAYALGRTPLLAKQFENVRLMVEAAHRALPAIGIMNLHAQGKSEETFVWEEDGAWCRVRTDWRANDNSLVLDYKTTECAAPEKWSTKIAEYGYDIQEHFYSRGVAEALHLKQVPRFLFMVQETTAPFLVSFVALPPMFQAMGEGKTNRGLEVWRECLSSGIWPGYSQDVVYVDPRPWALADWQLKGGDL